MFKKPWKWVGILFVAVALATRPVQSADAVHQTWDGVFGGTGSVLDGFFTFIGHLG